MILSWTLNSRHLLLTASLFFVAACSPVSKPALQPEPASAPASAGMERVEYYFQQGKSFLEQGDMEKARYYFDQSVDILLADQGEARGPQVLKREYIEKISSLERNFIDDRQGLENGKDVAFLDEVISTPLFSPNPRDVASLQQKMDSSRIYTIPMVVNSQVVSFIKAFQTIKQKSIQNALNRGQEYLPKFREILRKHQVPEDIAYLPIIESGFRARAVSRARAKGMWQFMASTARLYGLQVDWMVDERLDPYKSAEAAARFLRHLYEEYEDWYIALACYNGGPRRVVRAMNHKQSKDFFELNQTRIMRRETRNYVPAFLASLIIAKNPGEYGFEIGEHENAFGDFKMATIPSPVSLTSVSELLKLPLADLKRLNPSLLSDYTPPKSETYELRLPSGIDESPLANLERIPADKIPTRLLYTVRKGDSLYSISRKFRTTVQNLRRANGLRSNLIHPGQRLVIPRGKY